MKDEDNSKEFFGYLDNNKEMESIHIENNANKISAKMASLETNKKRTNSNSLKFCGEAIIIEKGNEDDEHLNILSNLVNICSLNEDIHKFLKREQLFRLEVNENLQNIFELEHRTNPQHKHPKFSDSEVIPKLEENRKTELNLKRKAQIIPSFTKHTDKKSGIETFSADFKCEENIVPKHTSPNKWENCNEEITSLSTKCMDMTPSMDKSQLKVCVHNYKP